MLETSQYALKHQQLLRDLKNTVEGLLASQVANVWSIYGGLNRLHSLLDKIFRHGYKQDNIKETGSSYFNFIEGLEWLQPENSNSCFSIDCEYHSHMPPHLKDDNSSIWLYSSLENHSLSQKLSWLLSDRSHVDACYQTYAFLSQDCYTEATLICLKALERNQPSLMSEINPCLFLLQTNSREIQKGHRRCSSFPDHCMKKRFDENLRKKSRTIHDMNLEIHKEVESPHHNSENKPIQGKLMPWHSMPDLLVDDYKLVGKKVINQCKTMPSTPVNTKKLSFPPISRNNTSDTFQSWKKKSNLKKGIPRISRKGVKHVIIDNNDIIEHTPSLSTSSNSGKTINDKFANLSIASLPEMKLCISTAPSPRSLVDYSFLPLPGEKDYKTHPRKSFIESGGMNVLPMSTGYFPKPTKGQSLLSFLTSSQFTRTNAELDRENAHFSISEAIISAVEQIRCKRDVHLHDEHLDESDPEIMDLKQRIRLRRRAKMVEKHRRIWASSILSDGKTDTTTSVSPRSTTPDTISDSSSSDVVEDFEIDEAANLTECRGLSMSMASLFSEADVKRSRGAPDGASDVLSAEGVAITLISKFNEKQLPRASDLEWLVSEEDAPQALLPLPKSWPVSPDDYEDELIPLRGTREWAPPRAQIIFTLHPPSTRKKLMEKQNYRCAGCSMKVAPKYASKFRYCDYLGRYFCTGCHANKLSLIPARILQKWDFTRYPVSTFSYKLLEEMYSDPLFRVFELNKNIGRMCKHLEFCRRYIIGLGYLKDFIFSCKYTETIQETLLVEMPHVLTDAEVFSMEDLVNIRSGEMSNKLKYLVELCCRHVSECKLCMGRGFICEICQDEEVIFPWQMRKVARCDKCGSCYHIRCWNNKQTPCVKCKRLYKRRESSVSMP